MHQRTTFALRSGIASIALAISATALAPVGHAAPAESCLSAPKGVAPQGSHWYYRIDRPSQRKCWYLADKGRKVAPSMYLGPLPAWALPLAARLVADGHMPAAPDQLIVNEYQPGQGITAQVPAVMNLD